MLNVVMLNAVMQNVVMLNAIMLNCIRLSAIMLNVVTPVIKSLQNNRSYSWRH
jgi:hypothetical protein